MSDEEKIIAADLETPAESALLKAAYKKSGLRIADLAAAADLSAGTITITLSGVRYRDGRPHVAIPPDRTLVKLAAVLGVRSNDLRDLGRDRAADLLDEANAASGQTITVSSDEDARAVAAGRQILARQVLAVFSSEELRAELARRDSVDDEESDEQIKAELAEDLRTAQYPG